MTPERIDRLRRVLDCRQPDLTIITDFVHKQRNLSAIIRNCDATGIVRINAVLGEADYQAFRGTTMGSHRWVEVRRHRDLESALVAAREQCWQIIAAHPGDSSADYRDIDYTLPTAILLGAEGHGVSSKARLHATACVGIPMVGMVGSLNVSVASGIILAEAQRQRQLAGMYDSARLDASTYQRLLFEWGHPQVREFCDQKGLAYPPLDEQGEIADPASWYASVRLGTAPRKSRRGHG